jgi:hypothetical protein
VREPATGEAALSPQNRLPHCRFVRPRRHDLSGAGKVSPHRGTPSVQELAGFAVVEQQSCPQLEDRSGRDTITRLGLLHEPARRTQLSSNVGRFPAARFACPDEERDRFGWKAGYRNSANHDTITAFSA